MNKLTRTRLVVAGAIVGLGTVVGAGAAGAATPNPYTPSDLPPVSNETEVAEVVEVNEAPGVALSAAAENATAQNTTVSTLPFTGGDAAGLAAIGAVALAAGTAITVSRRRTAV